MSFELNQIDIMGLTDKQKAAVMDAIVVTAWADGSVSDEEAKKFEGMLSKVPLAEDMGALVQESLNRVGQLKSPGDVEPFVKGIADALPLPHIREKVLYMMMSVAYAEGKFNQNEQNVITTFATAFGLTKERFGMIFNAATGKGGSN